MAGSPIHYANRDWRESEMLELCMALNEAGTLVEFAAHAGVWHVELDGNGYNRFVNWKECEGPSPWPALKAAVESLQERT